jgi:hypothetical protein
MSNNFENTSLVTKMAVKEFKNAMQMLAVVDRQWDSSFKKVGNVINIRRPVMFSAVTANATFAAEDIQEAVTTLTLSNHYHVDFTISQVDLKLSIEEANERYIKPAMIELAQQVESAIAAGYYNVANFSGTPGTKPSTFLDVANANAILDNLGVPDDGSRVGFFEPLAAVALANGLKGVFPQEIAKQAIEKAKIGMYGGVTMYKNQSQALHTVGINTGTPLVEGASQETTYALATATSNGWSQTLLVDGWTASQTGILKAGDVFTIAGVYSVNRRTRASTGALQTFTVLADANSGGGAGSASLTISPPIIISGSYKTCSASPANNAVVTVLTGTGGTAYRQNLMFHPNAITVGMAPLDVPVDGATSSVQSYDGISIAATRQFDIDSYLTKYRFDILFGVKYQNPDFAVRVTS